MNQSAKYANMQRCVILDIRKDTKTKFSGGGCSRQCFAATRNWKWVKTAEMVAPKRSCCKASVKSIAKKTGSQATPLAGKPCSHYFCAIIKLYCLVRQLHTCTSFVARSLEPLLCWELPQHSVNFQQLDSPLNVHPAGGNVFAVKRFVLSWRAVPLSKRTSCLA